MKSILFCCSASRKICIVFTSVLTSIASGSRRCSSRAGAQVLAAAMMLLPVSSSADPIITVFEGAAPDAAALTPVRDAFRAAIGGGVVPGPSGSFGGMRREINWDGVPDALADPNLLPANFFNVNSPRGVVFATPGTGFIVSADSSNPFGTPILFGLAGQPNEVEAFSAERVFSAVGSNIIDVFFYLPGTTTPAATSAFGLIFADVDLAGETQLQFFDENDALFFSRSALVADDGLSFLGVTVAGGLISRVRITAGTTTLLSNGLLGAPGDFVAMDDFLYAEPFRTSTVAEPGMLGLLGIGLAGIAGVRRRRYRA